MQLRQYQNESIIELRSAFRKGYKNIILALPTGSGKTVIFSEMARKAFHKNTRTLILTDRIELFKQTIKTLEHHKLPVQEIMANKKGIDSMAMLTLAMVETIKRRDTTFYHPELVIIDECHKGNFTKIFDMFPDARFIGATATPLGKHIPKLYEAIVNPIDIPELIEDGHLSPCKAFQMQDTFDDLKVSRGDYTDESLFNHFDERKLYDGVVNEWIKRGQGRKTLVFNVNIEHAENMTSQFKERGIVSECITSRTSKDERARILKAFKDGLIPVLNNCGILTTGYDEPSIEVIIMNRKTKSLPLWLQCCGRGSRTHPNKTHFTVLDFGMNHSEHGLWAESREWTLKQKKTKKGEKEAPVKSCPECDAMIHSIIKVCPYCGHEFKIVDSELSEGVMVEVLPFVPPQFIGKKVSQLSMLELIELQASKKYKPSFIWRIIRSRGEIALQEYAREMGYRSGWVWNQMSKMSQISFTDYTLR